MKPLRDFCPLPRASARKRHLACLAFALMFGASAAPSLATQQEQPPSRMPSKTCEDCHADRVLLFKTNAHGMGKHPTNGQLPDSVCEACHGDGKAHRDSGGEATLIYVPYQREGADRACLKCHDEFSKERGIPARARVHRHNGMHANSDTVNCLFCHSIQHDDPNSPYLLRKREVTLCAICHPAQVASLRNMPYTHRIGRGGMECSSCHDPHGLPGRDNIRDPATGELRCLQCHFEKRGPYAFEHDAAAAGDCLTCHEVHGSTDPKMLKRPKVAQLCLGCHSPLTPATLGALPPTFHNVSLPRFQNCTTCHVAIHGSNSDPHLFK